MPEAGRRAGSTLFNLFNAAFHVKIHLRHFVVFAFENFLEAANGIGHRHLLARTAREHFRHRKRLAEEALNFARAEHGELVFRRQFVHAQDRDDVLEVLVALQHLLHATRDFIVFLADNFGGERTRGRGEGIHRGINAQFGDGPFQYDGGVEVGEGRGRRGVGQIIGRHVDRLETGDRAFLGRSDAFLEVAHFGGESRLVTDGARRAPEQRGNFGAGLRETEDVIDEEQHILVLLVAEIFGHGQAGKGDAQAGPRWLVHLPVDQADLGSRLEHGKAVGSLFGMSLFVLLHRDDTGFNHFVIKIVSFAGPLTDAGEDGNAAVQFGDIVDQFHDYDGLADAGAAEGPDLASLQEWTDEVDDFDAGGQDLRAGGLVLQRRGQAMARVILVRLKGALLVNRRAGHVENAAHRAFADRHGDGRAAVGDFHAAFEAFGGGHGDGADPVVAQVLLHFEGQLGGRALHGVIDGQRVVERGQFIWKFDID